MNVIQMIAQALHQAGQCELFGVLGAGNLSFVGNAVNQYGMRYHALRHEAAAVAAADTYARVTGRIGVATVTHGPGLTHASSAIVEAVKSAVPLLVVTSAVGHTSSHQNQAFDQAAMVRCLGAKPVVLSEAASAYHLTQQALMHVRLQNQPVILIVPEDLQAKEVETSNIKLLAEQVGTEKPEESIGSADLDLAVQLLLGAERPVIIAGRGALGAIPIRNLREIGRQSGALLFTTLPAKDCFAGDAYNAGICGPFGAESLNNLANEADVVLVVGSSLSSWTTLRGQLFSHAKIIRCDRLPSASGYEEAVFLRGDSALVTSKILSRLRPMARKKGYRSQEMAATIHAALTKEFFDASDPTGLDPRIVMQALAKLLPQSRGVVIDGGHFSGWPVMFLPTPPSGNFIYAHGYQCVGLALGNAVGMAIASPEKLTIAFIGDGGLLMSLGELHAIGDLESPVLVVVLNDGAYGAEYHQVDQSYANLTELRRTDFAEVARSLGGTGISLRNINNFTMLSRWLENPEGLCLVDCHVTRNVKARWLLGEETP